MKKFLIVFLSLIAFASCSNIQEGRIIKKWYEPARTWVSVVPIVTSTGKTTTTTMVPMVHYDDEDYCIKIEKYVEDKEKYVTRTVYLTKEEYNNVELDDWFCISRDCKTKDRIEKHRQ